MEQHRHQLEAKSSWKTFQEQHNQVQQYPMDHESDQPQTATLSSLRRNLGIKHKHAKIKENESLVQLEQAKEEQYLLQVEKLEQKAHLKAMKSHQKRMKESYTQSPGIQSNTVHGFMIDAGSTGSRIHIYEWEPRVLYSHRDVQDAVAGKKLSFPSSQTRWSDRLRPGIASFATISEDDQLVKAIAEYLAPLLEFAKMVIRAKEGQYQSFPIFFRATAGMRTLSQEDRFRVLNAVRTLFHDPSYSPFYFEDEFARVLSGEEEAVFGWAGTNFIMGNLLQESQGAGTVNNPRLTYGALDMGGASTQISFYQPQEDIMAGLFKLQIGQGKHWNIYAHSFLYFGMDEARRRLQARLLAGVHNDSTRLITGVENPCLPGGTWQEVRLNIHYDKRGKETWDDHSGVSENGYYQGLLKNDKATGDFDLCMKYTKDLLHLEDNDWCEFAHRGQCSFDGVFMPDLPRQSEHFGEFLAISNYFHVWEFLGLPERASLDQLYNSTQMICNMNKAELIQFNKKTANVDGNEVEDYCFRSSYAFNVLHHGYGFGLHECITATDVINGQKVGWALGAMLYEINTFPWTYEKAKDEELSDKAFTNATRSQRGPQDIHDIFVWLVSLVMLCAIVGIFVNRRRRNRAQYEPLK